MLNSCLVRTCSANQGDCAVVSSHPPGLGFPTYHVAVGLWIDKLPPLESHLGDPPPQLILHEQYHRLSPVPLLLTSHFITLRPPRALCQTATGARNARPNSPTVAQFSPACLKSERNGA
jgi:hypothetical protein